MGKGYQRWFDISCTHSYFADQTCRPLSFIPTPDCRRLLQRYRLLFRAVPGGAEVYYNPEDPLKLLDGYAEKQPFTFAIHCSDPALLSFTHIASPTQCLDVPGIYYFDNLASALIDNDKRLLHAPGSPFGTGKLPLRAPRFNVSSTDNSAAGASVSLHGQSEAVWQTDGPLPATVDLAGLDDGRYRLHIGDDSTQDFYLSADINAARQWGVAAIHIASDPNAKLGQSYQIQLARRECVWCYYLISRSLEEGPIAGTILTSDRRREIGEPAAAINFDSVQPSTTVNGLPAMMYKSRQRLPLYEVPDSDLSFSFRADAGRASPGTERSLPYARPAELAYPVLDDLLPDSPQELQANIYVYW